MNEILIASLIEGMPEVFFIKDGKLFCRFDSVTIDFSGSLPVATFIMNGRDILSLPLEDIPPGGAITLQGFSAEMGVTLESD
jgi:hypothetical protein